jgi:hypothetical protein
MDLASFAAAMILAAIAYLAQPKLAAFLRG